jgi:hypothetical protein
MRGSLEKVLMKVINEGNDTIMVATMTQDKDFNDTMLI